MNNPQKIKGTFYYDECEYNVSLGLPALQFSIEIDGEDVVICRILEEDREKEMLLFMLNWLCRSQEKSILKERLTEIDKNND